MSGLRKFEKAYVEPVDTQVTVMEENESSLIFL